MIPDFYSVRPDWSERIEQIVELMGRVGAAEEILGRAPALRRANRIEAIHSSVAIEGNSLNLDQAVAVAGGHEVVASPREVVEIENALAAYDALEWLDPWSVEDFLAAHQLLTKGLTEESGEFRTVDVEIVNAHGEVIHTGSRSAKVPRLIEELLQWGRESDDHPLIVSSAVHFLIEHIHPFRDGNGRIGRLWQTLILSRWRQSFAWLPTETLIRNNQRGYYQALQASRDPEIDAAVFIEFMLGVILQTLREYEGQLRGPANVGTNVGRNVGVSDRIIDVLRLNPTATAAQLAALLDKSPRTIERHLAALVRVGTLTREGSTKTGRWIVNGGPLT